MLCPELQPHRPNHFACMHALLRRPMLPEHVPVGHQQLGLIIQVGRMTLGAGVTVLAALVPGVCELAFAGSEGLRGSSRPAAVHGCI